MRKLSLFTFISLYLILLHSCSKNDPLALSNNDTISSQTPEMRNLYSIVDSLWVEPSVAQLNLLWDDMINKATVDEIGSFLYTHGLFEWNYAQLLKEYNTNEYLLSVPTVRNDSISGVLFTMVIGGNHKYWYISSEEIQLSTEELVNKYGATSTITAVLTILKYEQFYGNYMHPFLYTHIYNPLLIGEITGITPRGWCLVEEIIYSTPDSEEENDDDGPCPCLYYNNNTAYIAENVGNDFNPEVDDPTWQEGHSFTFAPNDRSLIHGVDTGDGYTVYHFWTWCPDENDQNPWEHNWVNNTDNPDGGNSDSTPPPNWDYGNPRWTEDTRECMFIFNDPHATAKINQLEEQLLTQVCTGAAIFAVKNAIDNLVIDLCNEYYADQESSGGEVPDFPTSPLYNMDETLDQITATVENHSYYQLGIQTCEVCEEAPQPQPCYSEVENCHAEGYEECVMEILLEEFYDVDIEDTYLIDGVIYGKDTDGILHIYIDPIDMNNSTELEILEQIILVINKIHLYFCEGNAYEPIDWKDYFDNFSSVTSVVTWNDCQVGFDLTDIAQPYSIMETDPSWNHDTGSGWTYKWTGYNTNLPMLQITVDYGCTESFDNLIAPDCE